jgi:UDP-N-acetylmuramoyl-L-alanyl-D-glutamate--2,6-diaminopimelate ligase
MKLAQLLQTVPEAEINADPELEIHSLAYDSRRVSPGALFFAIQGEKTDGHRFIPQALASGAVAVVSERAAPPDHGSGWIRVPKIRRALSEASRTFYGKPDTRLLLVGITGTNGKTTTSYLVESILAAAGIPSGLFGTIEYRVAGRRIAAANTTPESLDLAAYLAEVLNAAGRAAVMEVSSHALAQERVWGFGFRVAVFTNLTQDHLDYHGTMENYFAAKRRLFEGLGTGPPETAVINQDDPWGARLLSLSYPRLITYGMNSEAHVRVEQWAQGPGGIQATLITPRGQLLIDSPLVGRPNLANILASTAVAEALSLPVESIRAGIAALRSVPGRFERVEEGQPFLVVVDYAHTDDALRQVLETARGLARGRVIVVFGCGGDRDRTKRPVMGEVAGSLSDLAVLTSDNPRSEDPLVIMNDVMVGLQKAGKPYVAEVDRQTAIRTALERARPGDVVVIAGKGHESYQILKDQTVPFDDRQVARGLLRDLGYGKQ